jgi:hypothetical protein
MTERIYPVTIIRTRYGGAYEGGVWAAFPVRADRVPPETTGDDRACMVWWEEYGAGVGLGATPESAVADLENKQWADGAPTRSVQAIATYLQDMVGPRIAAAIAGSADEAEIARYASGDGPGPDETVERRLREGHKVVRILVAAYDSKTAIAWMFGTNSQLDDRAPIELLGHATETADFTAVVKAARSAAHSWPA